MPITSKSLKLFRLTAGGTLVLLLLWLAFSKRPTTNRWLAISTEIKKGTIGSLPSEQAVLLKETLSWLLPHAGVNDSVVINGQPSPNKLHIYVTTPAAFEVTGCARGNALYDAQLDAIFIDEQIINPTEITRLGENSPGLKLSVKEFTFIPVYLRFIILHELGHRQLHRKTGGGFFDFNRGSRRLESEADSFAVSTLQLAYRSDLKSGGTRIGDGAGQFIQLDKTLLTDHEKVWADLIGAASSISLLMMFSASDFSSFYEDEAHPNFISRANSILTEALKTAEIGPELRARAIIYLQYLKRMENLSAYPFAEIHLPDGSQRVTFTRDQLFILSSQGYVFTIPLKNVQSSLSRSSKPIQIQLTKIPRINTENNPDLAAMSKVWAHAKTGPIILQPLMGKNKSGIEVQVLQHGQLKQLTGLQIELSDSNIGTTIFRQYRPWWQGGTDYDADVFLPPQPASIAVLRSNENSSNMLLLLQEGRLLQRIYLDTLAAKASLILKRPNLILSINTVTEKVIYLTVCQRINGHDQLVGVAEINTLTGKLDLVDMVNFADKDGYDMISAPNDKLLTIHGKELKNILFTRNRTQFLAFNIFTKKPAELIIEHPFMFDSVLSLYNINSDVLGAFDPILKDVKFVPTNYAIVVFENDSIYFVDLNSGKSIPLFSPGNFMKVAVSTDGLMAFFTHNGRKIYVLRSSDVINN